MEGQTTNEDPIATVRTRPRDWFEVGVRLIGVWTLVTLVSDVRALIELRLGWFVPQRTPIGMYVLRAVCDAAVGFYLLFWAPHLTRMVYGDDRARGFEVAAANEGKSP